MIRKIAFMLLVFVPLAAGLYAQEAGQWTAGGRLGAAFGLHSSRDMGGHFDDPGHSTVDEMRINFIFAGHGAYTFTDRISIQAELNFMVNQGYNLRVSVDGDLLHSEKVRYSSLDIPVLLRYNFLNSSSVFGILAGPHISIPIGMVEFSEGGNSDEFQIYTAATFGLSAGIFGGFRAGPGRVIGDLRFIFDFNSVEERREGAGGFEFMRRRALLFSLGYEMSF